MAEKKKKMDDGIVKNCKRDVFAVTQKAVVYDPVGKKFLIVKDSPIDGGDAIEVLGDWQFAGGHIDYADESVAEAIKREIVEELGDNFEFDLGGVFHTARADYGKNRRIMNSWLVTYVEGDISLSDEQLEYKWVTSEEIQNSDVYFEWLKDIVLSADQYIERSESHEKMLRTLAEFDNYKKRSSEQQKDFAKYASEKVIMEMLPVLDNFHAATGFVPEDQKDSPWLTGIMYIQQQMEKVFEDAGVRPIEVAVGDAFDAQKMEAIKAENPQGSDDASGEVENEQQEEQQKVSKVVQKGYMIADRVMRVARVELG